MPKGTYLGDFEQLVMLALMRLGSQAYGMIVRRELEEIADRRVSLGAIYATLDRLEAKGLVTSFLGAPGKERRGRAKRFFKVRASGVRALRASLASLDRMRNGIDELDQLVGVTP
jgi:DNA-binding PadR family transcriptional regulator